MIALKNKWKNCRKIKDHELFAELSLIRMPGLIGKHFQQCTFLVPLFIQVYSVMLLDCLNYVTFR